MSTEAAYERFVSSLFQKKSTGADGLMHAAAGMAGEAGEVLDLIKKIWANGRPLDFETHEKLVEELGDMMFYMQAMMELLTISPRDVRIANTYKLRKRYPNGYSDEAALARADKATVGANGGDPAPHSAPDVGGEGV